MFSFIKSIQLYFEKPHHLPYKAGDATALLFFVEKVQEQIKLKQSQTERISDTIVRITIGNEITDYYLPNRENEKLPDMDFSKLTPIEKYFGRFIDGKFTGIKYNYAIHLEKNGSRRFVESLWEYRQGQLTGEQTFFDADGNVIRRVSQLNDHLPYLTAKPA
jgi:hypothetical protein